MVVVVILWGLLCSVEPYPSCTLTDQERVTHLLVEGGGEEGDHVGEALQEGGVQVAVVSQHHQQWPQSAVHKLDVGLGVLCHELQRRKGGGGILTRVIPLLCQIG